MATKRFSSSALIHAPAHVVYGIIADYRNDHPQILPKPPFVSLDVEQGGTGSGTVMRVQMRVLGQLQMYHSVVTEPEPGRVLMETNDNGYITTFTVEPRADGQQAYVTIATDMTIPPGILGVLQGWFVPRLLRPVYVKELGKLEAYAATRETSTPSTRTY